MNFCRCLWHTFMLILGVLHAPECASYFYPAENLSRILGNAANSKNEYGDFHQRDTRLLIQGEIEVLALLPTSTPKTDNLNRGRHQTGKNSGHLFFYLFLSLLAVLTVLLFLYMQLQKRYRQLKKEKLKFKTKPYSTGEIRTYLSAILRSIEDLSAHSTNRIKKRLLPIRRNTQKLLQIQNLIPEYEKNKPNHTENILFNSERKNATNPIESKKLIILIITCIKEIQSMLNPALQEYYHVLEAENENDGYQLASEHLPDAVICELEIAETKNYKFFKNLKENPRTNPIPVILLSSHTISDNTQKLFGSNTEALITEPFNADQLHLKISKLINQRKLIINQLKHNSDVKLSTEIITSMDQQFINKLIRCIEKNIEDENFGVEELSVAIGLSRSQLHRKLTALVNVGPSQYLRNFRLERATELLLINSGTISEISYKVGFSSPSYFTKCFVEKFGYPPNEIRQRQLN
ncbi:MAG: DNA-binding response regulator [Bacteroidales bacterium]|nr:DNA-binding response regulator [Bacteroidales bacterium]